MAAVQRRDTVHHKQETDLRPVSFHGRTVPRHRVPSVFHRQRRSRNSQKQNRAEKNGHGYVYRYVPHYKMCNATVIFHLKTANSFRVRDLRGAGQLRAEFGVRREAG